MTEAKKQNITINNYCTAASCSSIQTKHLTIAQVLALPKFWIKKSPTNTMYINGQNYLDTIITGGYKVDIPRVCATTSDCTVTSKNNYVYSNTSSIAILSGGSTSVVTLNVSVKPNITAFNLSNSAVLAGEITTVTFEFEDNIPSDCTNPEYAYTIDLVDL